MCQVDPLDLTNPQDQEDRAALELMDNFDGYYCNPKKYVFMYR